jgi:uncharacterized repeat protein (TIGR01451 family)
LIRYSISYANQGTSEATGIVIRETVPAYTTFDSSESTVGWVCSAGGSAGDSCAFNLPGPLGIGDVGVVLFAVRVDSALDGSVTTIPNECTIEDDGNNGQDIDDSDNRSRIEIAVTFGPDKTIPTLTEWGILLMLLSIGALGWFRLRS